MADEYLQRYGAAAGSVVSIARSIDGGIDRTPDRLGDQRGGLTVAFAGSIRAGEHYRLLRAVATALRRSAGRVIVFGPMTVEQAAAVGPNEPNVHFKGMVDSTDAGGALAR